MEINNKQPTVRAEKFVKETPNAGRLTSKADAENAIDAACKVLNDAGVPYFVIVAADGGCTNSACATPIDLMRMRKAMNEVIGDAFKEKWGFDPDAVAKGNF